MQSNPYKIAVNWEWTSKCNARCVMCPQSQIQNPLLMKPVTFEQALSRIIQANLFRVVIAGYGEPTTHPEFFPFIEALRGQHQRFDMVTNGHLLSLDKIHHLDGVIDTLVVSFSSIVPEVYRKVHVGLDQERVKENILAAQTHLRQTRLVISLTPLEACLEHLDATVAWFRAQGVGGLSMSPNLYNRGGSLEAQETATRLLRSKIKAHKLQSQEFDFVPSLRDIFRQYRANKYLCVPRNVDLFITAAGDYLYCFNDITHQHVLGNVSQSTIEEALALRQQMDGITSLCQGCNMRSRYRLKECVKVALSYGRSKLA